MKQKTFVYVVNKKGQPLMPTTRCGHIRKLLKSKQAMVIKSNPFTIKLKYDTPNIVQSLYLGIDTGRENIGIAVSNENGDCVYLSTLRTNNKNIKKQMTGRREHRQSRKRFKRIAKQRKAIKNNTIIQNGKDDILRTKKSCKSIEISYPGMNKTVTHKVIKGAEAQFNNRRRKENWITPSARQCIQMHMNLVKQISKILPISHIALERVSFDFQKLENQNIKMWQYSKGPLYGFLSYKDYINNEQKGVCLLCNKNKIEYYHHIIQRKDGGTDNISNIAGLCNQCHYGNNGVHNNQDTSDLLLSLKQGLVSKYKIGLLNSVIPILIEELIQYCTNNNISFTITNGKETSQLRTNLCLPKLHSIDAYCISLVNRNITTCNVLPNIIFQQQRFKKKSKNIIHKLNRREYYYNGKLVAINRNKATDQKENSLKEYMEQYAQTHNEKECKQHFHLLEIKPAKRTYTYHKKRTISPIHIGDIVKYEKCNKIKGNVKHLVFIATGLNISENKVCHNTKNKKLNYCKRLESGCIPIIEKLSLTI